MNQGNGNSNTQSGNVGSTSAPNMVTDLAELIRSGLKFATVLADPPWRYCNTASRAAAENHYRTMTVQQICSEPVRQSG